MVFNQLCPPALIYLIFSTTQVIIDSVKGLYNTALMKIWVSILFTILLNYLCSLGLGTISWLIVFIPFILMTLVVAVLLLMFGLDPKTGKLKMQDNQNTNIINIVKVKIIHILMGMVLMKIMFQMRHLLVLWLPM